MISRMTRFIGSISDQIKTGFEWELKGGNNLKKLFILIILTSTLLFACDNVVWTEYEGVVTSNEYVENRIYVEGGIQHIVLDDKMTFKASRAYDYVKVGSKVVIRVREDNSIINIKYITE